MKLDFAGLNSYLIPRAQTLLASWLPGGKVKGAEFLVGDLSGSQGDSLSINLNTGKWKDFATSESGHDLCALFAAIKGLDAGAAFRALSEAHGFKGTTAQPLATQGDELSAPPQGMPAPIFNHPKYGEPEAVYEYKDASGNTLHFIARHVEADGKKQFIPHSWSKKTARWVRKAWPKPRPLYGLDQLAAFPNKPVLIVEGEKAAEYAIAIQSHYVVISWSGGASAWKQADWSQIKGREIIVWPDCDEPGFKAAHGICQILVTQNKTVKMITVEGKPAGWDIADSGFKNLSEMAAFAKPLARVVETRALSPEVLPPENESDVTPITGDYIKRHLPDKSASYKPLGTYPNFIELLNILNVKVKYNVISKREDIQIPGERFSMDNRGNASLAWLMSWVNAAQMPNGQLRAFVTLTADKNPYNPVADWIKSKPWDGKSRLCDLFDSVKAKHEHLPEVKMLKTTVMTRWMISAIAAAFEPDGVSAHGVLVFQGLENQGKTKWFRNLVSKELRDYVSDGRQLSPSDKDSVKQAVSFWLVELGELDATFRRADIAQLKAFLTKDRDLLRPAYAQTESEYARRTVFFASVNPQVFLNDPDGNRRFWTIECESINWNHGIEMQQLWAEVYQLYLDGESWFLTQDEFKLLRDHNEAFTSVDPVQERVAFDLAWESSEATWRWITVTQLLEDLGYERPTRAELNAAGLEISKHNKGRTKKSNGMKLRFLPMQKGKVREIQPFLGAGP